MQISHRRLALMAALALLSSGCGSSGASAPVVVPGAQVAPASSPPPALTDAEEVGWRQLQAARAALASATSLSGEFEAFSAGHFNGGKKEAALRKASSRSRVLWAAPERLRVEVQETATPFLTGAVLATADGSVLWAKGSGLLSLVPVRLVADDTRLATNRNHLFRDALPIAQLRRLTGKGANWKPGAGQPHVLTVTTVSRLDGEIDKETVTLDPATSRVTAIAAYVRGEKVTELRFIEQKWNPPIAGNPFRL
ncbi:MAG: hypothetical protein FJZ01_05075 [Candidatus Sericytochromatia bacterium]|nr:hypothetical protein [Candidatus Tanganyikabacteria bacterium]